MYVRRRNSIKRSYKTTPISGRPVCRTEIYPPMMQSFLLFLPQKQMKSYAFVCVFVSGKNPFNTFGLIFYKLCSNRNEALCAATAMVTQAVKYILYLLPLGFLWLVALLNTLPVSEQARWHVLALPFYFVFALGVRFPVFLSLFAFLHRLTVSSCSSMASLPSTIVVMLLML